MVGHDFRSYSLSIKQALTLGLISAGCEVLDIGLAVSPMAYFAQFDLDAPCVAMVTASHNENGWTGVKMGAGAAADLRPRRDGPAEGHRAGRRLVKERAGGKLTHVDGVAERYIADVASRCQLTRPLKVVCACGNGTAGAFAPEALRRMGAEVIEMDCELDWTFPQVQSQPRRPRDAARHGRGGARDTAPTWPWASTATATAAAWSTTRARRSSPTRSA